MIISITQGTGTPPAPAAPHPKSIPVDSVGLEGVAWPCCGFGRPGPPGGCLSPVDNSQWGRSCAAVTPPASPGRVRAAVHAPRERSPSSPSPSNKKNKQALEFCKECPQNVRTRSPHDTGHCMIQATVSTQSVGPSVRRSVGRSVGPSDGKNRALSPRAAGHRDDRRNSLQNSNAFPPDRKMKFFAFSFRVNKKTPFFSQKSPKIAFLGL